MSRILVVAVCVLLMMACADSGPGTPASALVAPGFDWRPESRFSCLVALDVYGADGIDETVLEYEVIAYTNGDVEVSCGSSLGTEEADAGWNYWPEPAKCAAQRLCLASSDYAPTTGDFAGHWQFATSDGAVTATYSDPDDPFGFDGQGYRFGDDDCAAAVMDDNGSWTRVQLEVVLR